MPHEIIRRNSRRRYRHNLPMRLFELMEPKILFTATLYYWTGAGNDHLWATANNWKNASNGAIATNPPGTDPGDQVELRDTNPGNIVLGSNVSLDWIHSNSGANNTINLNGHNLALNSVLQVQGTLAVTNSGASANLSMASITVGFFANNTATPYT